MAEVVPVVMKPWCRRRSIVGLVIYEVIFFAVPCFPPNGYRDSLACVYSRGLHATCLLFPEHIYEKLVRRLRLEHIFWWR